MPSSAAAHVSGSSQSKGGAAGRVPIRTGTAARQALGDPATGLAGAAEDEGRGLRVGAGSNTVVPLGRRVSLQRNVTPLRYPVNRGPAEGTRRCDPDRARSTAAERLIDTHGPDAASVRAVADAVGTTTRAVYSVFGSKHGLLEALATRLFEVLSDAIDAVPCTDDVAGDLVEAGVRAFRQTALDHPSLYRLVFVQVVPDLDSAATSARSRPRRSRASNISSRGSTKPARSAPARSAMPPSRSTP